MIVDKPVVDRLYQDRWHLRKRLKSRADGQDAESFITIQVSVVHGGTLGWATTNEQMVCQMAWIGWRYMA